MWIVIVAVLVLIGCTIAHIVFGVPIVKPRAIKPKYSGSRVIKNPTPGESNILASPLPYEQPIAQWTAEVKTVYDNFAVAARKYSSRPFLGRRVDDGPFEWSTYGQVQTRVHHFGAGLVTATGLVPGQREFVGIFSANRLEWFITENACYLYSWVPVPLYDTLGAEAMEFIIEQTKLTTIVCSKERVPAILKILDAGKCKTLRHIVQMESAADVTQRANVVEKGLQLHTLHELEYAGAAKPVAHVPPKPTDLFTLCYTSGTTGLPKGAMLTHGQMIAEVAASRLCAAVYPDDVYLSYLPLSHVYERVVVQNLLSQGACIGIFRGDVLKLFDDITSLRPTVFASVPRLFNRLFDKVQAGLNAKPVARLLYDIAFRQKRAALADGHLTHWLWDRIMFAQIKKVLGGRVRLMISGSAPLSSEVMEFLRVAFCCPVQEGYGQTENCAAAFTTFADDLSLHHVGVPVPTLEAKLVDIPDMNYFTAGAEPKGEVCLRGPMIFSGYYLQEDKTRETLDADGWLHTGDVGMFTPQNTLRIIDRKKNIFKLAQGEYVAPEKIENVYVRSQLVAQCFVHGDSLKASLVAVVVPDAEEVRLWAVKNHVEGADDFAALCKNSKLHRAIAESMDSCAKQSGLKGFECVKKIHVCAQPFSVESDLLTPTFKLKRHQAAAHFAKEIEQMYKAVD